MLTLQNEKISIKVKPFGAELCSIFHKENQLEYMWQAGSEWPKHSPILFPIVGQLKDNFFVHEDKHFALPRHGFAREKNFSLIEQGPNRLVFRLRNDDDTLKYYPFHFNLEVEYALQENNVIVTYIVENTHHENMFFSIGAHPAFKVPLYENENYNDYKILFDVDVVADNWPLEQGLIKENPKPYFKNESELLLTKEMFKNDALVFKKFGASSLTLQSKNHSRGLKFELNQAPYLGLWAASNADFICIEPWHGIADSVNSNGQLNTKEGIIKLLPKDEFKYSYSINVF